MANTRRILAIEAIAACQALEFLQAPGDLARPERGLRARPPDGPPYDTDRVLSPEIEAVAAVVSEGTLAHDAGAVCGTLE